MKPFLVLRRKAPNYYKAVGALFLPDEVALVPGFLVVAGRRYLLLPSLEAAPSLAGLLGRWVASTGDEPP